MARNDASVEAQRPPPSESTPLLTADPSSVVDLAVAPPQETWASELWLLVRFAIPCICTYLLQYSWCIIVTVIAGHLSADDLAAASIGMTTMNIFGFAPFEGMATALDTLCSQSYGSGNYATVGLHIQRMLLIMAMTAVPIAAVWAASPWFLAAFVKQHNLALLAGTFLRYSIIGMPGYASFEALKRLLQAQGDFKVAMVILIICTPTNAVLAWLFAFKLDMGLAGAALGTALTNLLRPALLLLYIATPFGRWSLKCWGGFSRAALSVSKWRPMIKLSFAGFIVNLAEWGAFEIVAFSTSYLSTNHLAAQTILTTISVVSWHIPFSISIGISTRIGHLIGAGLLPTARRAAFLYGCVFVLIGCFDGLVVFLLRNVVPQILTDDPIVSTMARNTMLACSVFQIIDAFICYTNGMLRGLGRQSVAAWVVTIINYFGAVPFAIWLELATPLQLNGVWIGIGCGMVVIATVESSYIKFLRWQDCVDSAKLREGLEDDS